MSADLLRRAAKTLRDTAASCEQGDWTAEVGDTGTAWVNLPAYPHAWGMHGFAEESRYVALVGAPVGLLLAAHLEDFADSLDQDLGIVQDSGTAGAIEIARAILREES